MEGEVIFEEILSNKDILKQINTQRLYIYSLLLKDPLKNALQKKEK